MVNKQDFEHRKHAYGKFINNHHVHSLESIDYERDFVRAKGQYIYDSSGNRYLDMIGGYGVHALGRNADSIKRALIDVLESDSPSLVHMDIPSFSSQLAEALISLAPEPLEKVFFANSGTESVECAIKCARRTTGRNKLLFCHGAFHGLSTGALALNGDRPEFRTGYGDLLSNEAIPYNDIDALREHLSKKDIAAFFVEPIQGKSMKVASKAFLSAAQSLCKETGTLLVIDEVQTGLGRTGCYFASEHTNTHPDILVLSKVLSGGVMPVGACLMSTPVYEASFSEELWWTHSSTFRQNDLAMVAGLATLETLDTENLIEHVNTIGNYLNAKIEHMTKTNSKIIGIQGRGLLRSVLIDLPKEDVFPKVVAPLFRQHNILMQPADWLKLSPPFVITEDDIDYFCEALTQTLSTV